MPLGMDVGVNPGDFVLDGEPVPAPRQGAEPPNFRPMFIVDVSICHWYGSSCLGLRDIVLDVDPAPPRKKGTPTPTQFLAHVYCGQMAG